MHMSSYTLSGQLPGDAQLHRAVGWKRTGSRFELSLDEGDTDQALFGLPFYTHIIQISQRYLHFFFYLGGNPLQDGGFSPQFQKSAHVHSVWVLSFGAQALKVSPLFLFSSPP
ncbi:hypothetical protein ATANTOWER_016303 [Ataeniobius toweri]|uniref:Uncharacterized protein n=1 Tax=Ataeniobius toweri TaxID=208326 RepID=A0ABU7BDC6_9TELE|nr:hypothetical protein [Ataeniobius toweri]